MKNGTKIQGNIKSSKLELARLMQMKVYLNGRCFGFHRKLQFTTEIH